MWYIEIVTFVKVNKTMNPLRILQTERVDIINETKSGFLHMHIYGAYGVDAR